MNQLDISTGLGTDYWFYWPKTGQRAGRCILRRINGDAPSATAPSLMHYLGCRAAAIVGVQSAGKFRANAME